MALPVNAHIEAAQSFLRSVRAAEEFMLQQDATGAAARYAALLAQLTEARQHLRWNPAAGRPARFGQTRSAQGQPWPHAPPPWPRSIACLNCAN